MNSDNDYSASGFDKFLSRDGGQSLQGPLDQESPNRALPFDRTQVGGAPGDAYRVGNIFIDGTNGQIYVNDASNKRIILGTQSNSKQSLIISKEGKDADSNRPQDLLFNSEQTLFQVALAGDYQFPAVSLAPSTTTTQSFSIKHNVTGIPGYLVYYRIANDNRGHHTGFPGNYYAQLIDNASVYEPINALYTSTYGVGADENKLYINRSIANAGATTETSSVVIIKYYIFQQSVTS